MAAAGKEVLMRRLSLALLLLLVPLAAACSNDTLSVDPVARAAETTSKADTMHMSMRMRVTAPGLGVVTMTADGAFDNSARRGSMTLDMSDFARQMPDKSLADPSLWRGEEIFDASKHPVIYMRFPFMSRALPGSKPWIRIDLEQLGAQAGVDFGALMQSGQSNPAQQLDYLRSVSGDLKELGQETVGGVETTHYRGTVDLEDYAKLVPKDQRESVRKTIEQLEKNLGGASTYPVDVWVDSADRVRRMAFDMKSETPQGTVTTSMQMDLSDFGAPVNVELPPKSQTMNFDELSGGAK
jgi:hypothetical protein